MATRLFRILSLATLIALGCGPIEYVNQVTRRASTKVEEARAAKADKLAPYEYTLAVEYLTKAREEASFADYQAANRFGRLAAAAASKAAELAAARAADPRKAEKELRPPNIPTESEDVLVPAEKDRDGKKEVPPDLGGDT